MRHRVPHLSLILIGWLSVHSEAAPLQNIFTDVTSTTLGDVPHVVPTTNDIKIGTGAAWFDYDRDRDLDLYMTNRLGANRLWRNDGAGKFTEVTSSAGAADSAHDGSGVAVADYDNDGDLDLYLANSKEDVLLKNQLVETGTATFKDVTATAFPGPVLLQRGTTASWGDYDEDGYVDLYVANHRAISGTGAGQQDHLFHNNGNGTFTDVSSLLLGGDADGDGADDHLGGYGFIGGWTDYDNDGDLDILLINDCPFGPENTKLFRNDGGNSPLTWNFTEVGASVGAADCINGMGLAFGDYNRDGWRDYFYTNAGIPILLRNDGGRFANATEAAGLADGKVPVTGGNRVTWGTIFFDYDLDGFLDLCVAAGAITASTSTFPNPNLLYHNDGNGVTFTDVSVGSGINDTGRGRTIVMGDYDQDGDPDLFLVNHGERAFLFRNDYANTTGRHWFILNLQGAGPPLSNRDGIGAKVEVTTPDGIVQHWETRSGDSLGGGSDLAAYFGLKGNSLISQLEVTWPSGITQTVTNIAVDQRMSLAERGSPTPTPSPTPTATPKPTSPITVTSPNGKEVWAKGSTHTITWTGSLVGEVAIKLLNGRTTALVVAASTVSDGSFEWKVPNSLAEGDGYRVEVSSVNDSTIKDQSDRRFSIASATLTQRR